MHVAGMLLWMFVVIHQLLTKGRSKHKIVGYLGLFVVVSNLASSYPAVIHTSVPSLHSIMGLTVFDVVLLLTVVGIIEESVTAVLKARNGQFSEHCQHAICAVFFTAAPGLYRFFVYLMLAIPGLFWDKSNDTSDETLALLQDFDSVMMHEVVLCLAVMVGLCLLLFPTTSGQHMTAIHRTRAQTSTTGAANDGGHRDGIDTEKKKKVPNWQVLLAWFMLLISGLAITLFGIIIVDSVLARLSSSQAIQLDPSMPGGQLSIPFLWANAPFFCMVFF